MRGSKAKRLRRRIFGVGYHWPTVKADKRLRNLYRQLKVAVQRIDRGDVPKS